MPRIRKRKTNRGTDNEVMNRAADMCLMEGKSERAVAKYFNICHVSLNRFIKNLKIHQSGCGPEPKCGYKPHTRVFDNCQEIQLTNYLKNCADMYFGLSSKDVRKLAFEYALKLKLKIPPYWVNNEFAGVDWFANFLKRNPTLSIRQPESTSLSRAMNFNPINVKMFMDKYESVLIKYRLEPHQIYNLDETGITTVQNPGKIIAQKGKKQVGAITSAERGTLVTMCLAVSAIGNSIPPMFIFPRVHYQDYFIRGGPPGCIGTANRSGWMQSEDFLIFMKHFCNHVRPTLEKKVLVLLDNHESHLYIPVIDYCRKSGIILLSFPPHCSHKLQPLDRSVFGPFKKFLNQEMDSWIKTNPGKRVSIYDLPAISSNALINATTPRNITKGFSVSGVWPFNRNIFTDDEFAPAVVTNIMLDNTLQNTLMIDETFCSPSTSKESVTTEILVQEPVVDVSPESVRPYPKAKLTQKKTKKGGRKKGKSAILTDTPEKEELFQKYIKKKKTNRKLFENEVEKKKQKSKVTKKMKKKKTIEKSEDEEDDTFCAICEGMFSSSKSGESWIQCCRCKFWLHEACTEIEFSAFYICDNCQTDDE